MSLIDIGTTAYIANTTTQALFKTNAWNFFTDGWLGRRASSATDNSYEFSLYELMTGALGLDAYSSSATGVYGVTSSNSNQAKYAMDQIKANAQANGGKLVGTIFVAPIMAKMAKKFLAKPLINPVNRTLKKIGISQATGVKL